MSSVGNECVSLESLPTLPRRNETSWRLGRLLSKIRKDSARIGEKVRMSSTLIEGTVRWTGVLNGHQHVGVEWDSAPPNCELCDGTWNGEKLFYEATSGKAHSSFERLSGLTSPSNRPLKTFSKAVLITLRHLIYVQFFPRFVADCCTLATPVILEYFIEFLMEPQPSWVRGFTLVTCFFAISLAQSLMTNLYSQVSTLCGLSFRSALTSLIFEKTFTVSSGAISHPDYSSGRIVNMVSNDIEKVNQFWWTAMDVWSIPFQIVVSIGLLYRLVGWCGVVAVGILFLSLPTDGLILRAQNRFQANLSKAMDDRIRNTVEVLSNIRIVKYMGWESLFLSRITERRAKEIENMRLVHICRSASALINYATPRLIVAVTVVIYHSLGNPLKPQIIFPAVSILGILRVPFMNLPTLFTNISQFRVAFNRLATFIELADRSLSSRTSEHDDVNSVVEGEVQVQSLRKVSLSVAQRACCGTKESLTDVYVCEKKVILRDIRFRIPKGKLTVVTGSTGSGKSCLLQALQGLSAVLKGQWDGENSVLVPQTVWVMAGTIKENICFFGNIDEERLNAVIAACALQKDIQSMPKGVDTELSEKGVSLSGGQKSRVALARAAFSTNKLVLIDDVTSALDTVVADAVVQNCLMGFLSDRTRVVVSQHASLLQCADNIVSLGRNGEIEFEGSPAAFKDFCDTTSSLRHVSVSTLKPAPILDIVEASMHKAKVAAQVAEAASSRFFSGESHATFAHPGVQSDDETDSTLEYYEESEEGTELSSNFATQYYLDKAAEDSPSQQRLIQSSVARRRELAGLEEKSSGSVPFSAYVAHWKACGGIHVVIFVLCIFALTEAINSGASVWLSIWIGRVGGLSDSEYRNIYLGLVAAGFVSAPFRFHFSLQALRRGSLHLHNDMLLSVLKAPVAFFDTTPLGRIINRFTRDVGFFDVSIQLNYLGLLQCVFFAIASVTITVVSQPVIATAIVPCGFLYYTLLVFFNRTNREVRRLVNLASTPVMNVLTEVLSGLTTIQAFEAERFFMSRALQQIDTMFGASNLQNVCNRWLCLRVEIIGNVIVTTVASVAVVGKLKNFNSDNISLLSLGVTMSLTITQMLNWIVRQVAAVEADMNCVERMLFYAHQLDNEKLTVSEPALKDTERTRPDAPSVEFKHVTLRYRPSLPLVLQNVSFKIRAGEKVGVVGRTGSGKSTLLLALLRIVEVAPGGSILIRNKPSSEMPLEMVRRTFSLIPQDPVLFEGTLRGNLDPTGVCSDNQLWKALELVEMVGRVSFDQQKLDMRVVFGGQNFSVGERQMLCLARALLKTSASCLLMDEATASVDNRLDAMVKELIRTAFKNYTVITVAHRLHTVAEYDKVIVMDAGRVAELGTPHELSQNKQGIFSTMLAALGKEEEEKLRKIMDSSRKSSKAEESGKVSE